MRAQKRLNATNELTPFLLETLCTSRAARCDSTEKLSVEKGEKGIAPPAITFAYVRNLNS